MFTLIVSSSYSGIFSPLGGVFSFHTICYPQKEDAIFYLGLLPLCGISLLVLVIILHGSLIIVPHPMTRFGNPVRIPRNSMVEFCEYSDSRPFGTPEFSSEFHFTDRKTCSHQLWRLTRQFKILSCHWFFQFHASENIPTIFMLHAKTTSTCFPSKTSRFVSVLSEILPYASVQTMQLCFGWGCRTFQTASHVHAHLYEVFECLLRLWMGMWFHIHIITSTNSSPDLW